MLKNELFFKKEPMRVISAYANRINDEQKSGAVGYYHLFDSSKALLSEVGEFMRDKKHLKKLCLLGMGGSSCGVKALQDFLFDEKRGEMELFIIDNTSSHTFTQIMSRLNPTDTLFVISSKTGTTIEVVSLFKLIISHFGLNLEDLKENFIFITDANSRLHKLGQSLKIQCFLIPQNVGGRFSVLSAVGIVPLTICGFNTAALLEGARACFEDFFTHKKDEILQKAYHYCTHKNAHMNVLFSYGNAFKGFNEWFVQLIAESLGKKQGYKRVGITPIALIGARDQHSFLQLIMDGPKDKTITFLKVKDAAKSPIVPEFSLEFLDECDFAKGVNLHSLLNAQCDATMNALIAENLSVDLIEIERLDAWHAGYLMYYYELLTSCCGIMLGINTYDQPGVEVGKLILRKILER